MTNVERIQGELSMGLRLIAFQSVKLTDAPMADVEEALRAEQWDAISAPTQDGVKRSRYYYGSSVKEYVKLVCDEATNESFIEKADETDVLESLSFEELKTLGNLIDKKSVAFIRIYSDKELASAKTAEELAALNERNQKMIDEAEVALRKR